MMMLVTNGHTGLPVRQSWIAPIALGLAAFLAGCSGGTGAMGPAGPSGATGPAGATGPTGPIAALQIGTASSITATITSVTFPSGAPIKPVVSFQLVNQVGEPLKGLTAGEIYFAIAKLVPAGTQLAAVPPQTSAPAPLPGAQWQSYIYSSVNPAPASAGTATEPVVGTSPQPQATIEPGATGTLVDNGDGTYKYTFKKDISADPAVSYDATLTHRVGFEIRGVTDASGNTIAANSPVYTFQPSSGATTGITQRDIVDDKDCKNCHQVLAWHGGARTETQYCVLCHNPSSFDPSSGNSIDFKVMFHKIHMGSSLPSVLGSKTPASLGLAPATATNYYIFGFRNAISDFSAVAFPRGDASNNNATVSGNGTRFCTTCHNTADVATPQASNYASIPSAAACGSCHDNINFASGIGHSAANLPATDDQCVTCHGPSSTISNGSLQVVAAHTTAVDAAIAKFQYKVLSIVNTAPGQTPVATVQVTDPTNANAPYDITDPAGPFQVAGSALNLDIAWNTIDINNVGSGSAPSASAGTPNLPITINFKAGGAALIKNGDGSFSLAAAKPIPATATGSGIASLEGRAVLALQNLGATGTTAAQLGVPGNSLTFAITDPTPTPRNAIVSITKCDTCHRTLTLHGQNRTDDINLCASCHNPNATDAVVHTAASGACAPGTPDNPIDFKVMIHQIHASGDPHAYGTNGVTICAFGGNAATFKVLYPSSNNASLGNCQACHNSGTYYPVDPTIIQGTTILANDRTTLTDDVVISPNSAVCSSCHTDTTAMNHMAQNGGNFAATKTATGALNPGSTETCGICHNAGAVADVAVVHKLSSYH
jgi:OmcA/MtrC family decaheme c-type cytochrome